MNDEIDYKAVTKQLQLENENLRRKLAKRYMSMPPIIDEIKWKVGRFFAWFDTLNPEKLALLFTGVTIAWGIIEAVLRGLASRGE